MSHCLLLPAQTHRAELDALLRPTLDVAMTLRYPSGNYPSSIGSASDRLVHWCHGAPGWVHTFVKAHEVRGRLPLLRSARLLLVGVTTHHTQTIRVLICSSAFMLSGLRHIQCSR